MARKPTPRNEFVLFNVTYEDGTQRSNRRVPADLLGGIDGDEPARALIEEQDREISAKSGMPPLAIKRIVRVDDDVKERVRDTRRANERRAAADRIARKSGLFGPLCGPRGVLGRQDALALVDEIGPGRVRTTAAGPRAGAPSPDRSLRGKS